MSDKRFEKQPSASSSASLDEHLARRALPRALDVPLPYSQTALALDAVTEETKPAPQRQALSLNDLHDPASDSDETEPTSPKIQRDTLLALLYELEDEYLGSDVELTADRREGLKRCQEWVQELRKELDRQLKLLPKQVNHLKFERIFLSYYNPFIRRMEKVMNGRMDSPSPGKLPRRKKGLRQRWSGPAINRAAFKHFLPKIETFEAMTVDRRGTAEVQAEIAALRADYLRILVGFTDVRYVEVTTKIRQRILALCNSNNLIP